MSTVAIIAEYNPFHNGHLYHLNESKRITGAENAIAIMSGNFVQRGEPAVLPKLKRAEYAVRSGLDIVFEMPVRYSTASAQDFAYAGVEMINSLGIADYLSFGAETNDIDVLQKISDCLTDETASFKSSLNDYLKEGNSYPKARSLALAEELGVEYAEIMSKPNNILAIEYLSALTKLDSSIKPVAVTRKGAGHDGNISEDNYASGKMIREMLHNNDAITSFMPYSIEDKKAIYGTDMESLLNYELLKIKQCSSEEAINKYSDILDITPELINKIRNLTLPASYEDIIESLKSKEITRSRICRVLIHFLLEIKDIKNEIYCPYATILALRKDSSGLLRDTGNRSKIELINKRSDYNPDNKYSASLYKYDRKATDLYNLLWYDKYKEIFRNELSSNIIVF